MRFVFSTQAPTSLIVTAIMSQKSAKIPLSAKLQSAPHEIKKEVLCSQPSMETTKPTTTIQVTPTTAQPKSQIKPKKVITIEPQPAKTITVEPQPEKTIEKTITAEPQPEKTIEKTQLIPTVTSTTTMETSNQKPTTQIPTAKTQIKQKIGLKSQQTTK